MVQSGLGHVHRPVRRLVLLLPRRTPPDSYPGQPPWLERLAFNVRRSTFNVAFQRLAFGARVLAILGRRLSYFSAKKRTAKYEGHDDVTATTRQTPNAER